MADSVLADLAQQVLEVSHSKEHQQRRDLWVQFHALRPPRPLVHYAMYTGVWEREIAYPERLRHHTGLARLIEVQLRAKLWKAQHIPDDEPLLPTIWLTTPHPPGDARLWGVALPVVRTEEWGAYKPVPPIQEESDLEKLHYPPYEEVPSLKSKMLEAAMELTGGLLPIKFHSDELHYGPIEWAVRLRGMDNLLYDVIDRPQFVHRLMDFITEGMVRYHRAREAAGAVDAEASWAIHMIYDTVPPGKENLLSGCWAYIHAQSAASLSPRMYAEFVHPYNARLATLFGRVYYHGCEDLSAKAAIIKDLPNLRLFHVSPWTPVEPVVRVLGDRLALEVHSHPTKVLFEYSAQEMREELRQRHEAAKGTVHVLKLCDVETVGNNWQRLRRWAELAREIVEN
jgi:hypothetical protein